MKKKNPRRNSRRHKYVQVSWRVDITAQLNEDNEKNWRLLIFKVVH